MTIELAKDVSIVERHRDMLVAVGDDQTSILVSGKEKSPQLLTDHCRFRAQEEGSSLHHYFMCDMAQATRFYMSRKVCPDRTDASYGA